MAIYKGTTLLTSDGSLDSFASFTTTQRDALTPVEGEVIWNTTTEKAQFYDGTDWVDLTINVPSNDVTIRYLVVGGGGSGGAASPSNDRASGGGGAGGYRAASGLVRAKGTAYTVTVGAGGAKVSTTGVQGNDGTSSVFDTITSGAGGGGGSAQVSGTLVANNHGRDGVDGGSGGGAGGIVNATGGTGGSYGNDGADMSVTCCTSTSGGGSGGAGPDHVFNQDSVGGAGTSNDITGTSVTYAAGGRGRSGGSHVASVNATANSGNGGEGAGGDGYNSCSNCYGGAGGSGVVILRFPDYSGWVVSSGLGYTSSTSGSDRILKFTSGTGTITF